MATFLELCRSVRLLSGMQGTGPADVSTVIGVEAQIVRYVRDAYIDIQNLRDSFPFLEDSKSFITSISVDTYTAPTIFITAVPDLKKYQDNSFFVTVDGIKYPLIKMDRNEMELRYLNDTSVGPPSHYCIIEKDNSIQIKPIPDKNYSISFRYWKNPEILSTENQVPILPLSFHQLIVYKALEKLSIYLSAPEVYREYALETTKMLGQLMRHNLPKKRMRSRPLV
jgi:hypothetical protein